MWSQIAVVAGWAGTPLLGFIVAGVAVRRQERRVSTFTPVVPVRRLEELRAERARRPEAVRGRMAEAVRLAEAGYGGSSSLHPRS